MKIKEIFSLRLLHYLSLTLIAFGFSLVGFPKLKHFYRVRKIENLKIVYPSREEGFIIDLISNARASKSLPKLLYSDALTKIAKYHWLNLLEKGEFSHNQFNNFVDNGVFGAICGCSSLGEVLSRGLDTPEETVEGWLNSPSHREALMTSGARRFGIYRDIGSKLTVLVLSD